MTGVTVTMPSEPKSIWDLTTDIDEAEDFAATVCEAIDGMPEAPHALEVLVNETWRRIRACSELANALMKAQPAEAPNVVALPVAKRKAVRR